MKKALRKVMCVFLSTILVLTTASVTIAAEQPMEKIENNSTIILKGLEYSDDLPLVDSEEQLDHRFVISSLKVQEGTVNLQGEVSFGDSAIFEVNSEGTVYTDDSPLSQKTGRTTFMFEPQEDYSILNLNVQEQADGAMLFPVNAGLDDKPIMQVAIKHGGTIYYFEDGLEQNVMPSQIKQFALDVPAENDESTSKALLTQESAGDEQNLGEDIQASNSWQFFEGSSMQDDVTILDDNSVDSELNAVAATPTGVPYGIPSNVFTSTGKWASVNNPTYQTMGYYAVTNPQSGTSNRITTLIQWEYIYNPCSNLPNNQNVASSGVTSIKIKTMGEYMYVAARNSVELIGTYSYMRLQEPTILMAMMSNQQILSNATTTFVSQGSNLTINWLECLGLVNNVVFQTAATLLGAIEYKDVDHSTACMDYQDTAKKQIQTYGKVIRGRKISHNGNKLTKEGDYLRIAFTIRQPSDLTSSAGKKEIVNKYFFHVYRRNSVGVYERVYTVEQLRSSYYSVYN